MIWKFRGFDATGQLGWVYGDLIRKALVGGYVVEPDSIGLFTGLKDSNGTDIYEGDILSVSYDGKKVFDAPVIWHKDYAAFYIDEGDGCFSPIPNVALLSEIRVEVIGNVYENKKD